MAEYFAVVGADLLAKTSGYRAVFEALCVPVLGAGGGLPGADAAWAGPAVGALMVETQVSLLVSLAVRSSNPFALIAPSGQAADRAVEAFYISIDDVGPVRALRHSQTTTISSRRSSTSSQTGRRALLRWSSGHDVRLSSTHSRRSATISSCSCPPGVKTTRSGPVLVGPMERCGYAR